MKEWQKNTKERTRFIPEENKIEDEVNLLKELYGNSNNKFGLIKRLAKQKEINYYSLRNRINRLTEKIDKNEEFRNLVINYYPTLLEDKERYENGSTKLSNEEKLAIKEEKYLKESVKLLQLTLQRQENDKYLSNDEIADYFSIKKSSLFVRKRILKEKLQDNAFLEKVIKLYPDYLNDLEIYKNTKNAKTNKSIDKEEKKLNDAVNFLTNLFIKKNGIFLNTTAIANMMGLKYPTFINKRKKYLLEYDTNEELRKIVLSKCPTFDQDRIVFQSQIKVGRKYVYNDEKSEKDALFLIRCVARDECNKFPSFKSIALESNSTVEKVQEKFNKLSKIFNENEDFRNKVLKIMPYFIEEYNHFIEENNNQLEEKNIDDSLIDDDLTYKEQLVINSLYSGESKTLISKSKIAKNLNISPAYFSILENSAIKKITNNPNINKLYPKVLEEAFIRKNHSVRRSIKINAEEINSIKDKARLYDIPKYDFSDTKSKLIEAIKFLDESIYKDYISLCTIEQKAILALRFGFLNNYSYSSKDISELFNITSNEVDILVNECIKFSNLYNDKEKEFKK